MRALAWFGLVLNYAIRSFINGIAAGKPRKNMQSQKNPLSPKAVGQCLAALDVLTLGAAQQDADVVACLTLVEHLFFNYPATTEIYTLSLPDALPI